MSYYFDTRNITNHLIDKFEKMVERGLFIVYRAIQDEIFGGINLEDNVWYLPETLIKISPGN